jgi:hypothetical protein
MYLDIYHDWPHFPRAPAQLAGSVPTVLRSPPKAQSGEVPTISGESAVTRAYCVIRGDNHRPQEDESLTGMANTEEQTQN